jgi:ferric-dicitrate binding protein FerR (iron transport regulator)
MRAVFGLIAIVALTSALQADPAAAEPKIGVASAARNQVQGIIGGGTRTLSAGSEIFSNEVVRTGDDSLAQLLFLDATSLSVGARSEVKLDRFVYNPDRKTGNMVVEASRGAFRFVSGSQAPTNYTIKTPLATIGVRGTIVDGYITSAGVQIVVWEGHALVAAFGTTRDLGPGHALFVSVNGQIHEVQWDGTGFDNLFNVNFPLFGRQWELDPGFIPQPDNPRDLNDQLNAKGLQGLPLPAPPSTGRPGRGGG